MEIIKVTGLFHPIMRLHPNSVLVVNKPVKQHPCVKMVSVSSQET